MGCFGTFSLASSKPDAVEMAATTASVVSSKTRDLGFAMTGGGVAAGFGSRCLWRNWCEYDDTSSRSSSLAWSLSEGWSNANIGDEANVIGDGGCSALLCSRWKWSRSASSRRALSVGWEIHLDRNQSLTSLTFQEE